MIVCALDRVPAQPFLCLAFYRTRWTNSCQWKSKQEFSLGSQASSLGLLKKLLKFVRYL
jgi:hypothetical protein